MWPGKRARDPRRNGVFWQSALGLALLVAACAGESLEAAPGVTDAGSGGAPDAMGGASGRAATGGAGGMTAAGGEAGGGAQGLAPSGGTAGTATSGGEAGAAGAANAAGQGGGNAPVCESATVVTGDLNLALQADVEALRGVGMIDGTVFVGGDVTDLEPLGCLREVTGDLWIAGAQQLEDVDGLVSLRLVGGELAIAEWCEDYLDGFNCTGTNLKLASVRLEALESAASLRVFQSCDDECFGNLRLERIELPALDSVDYISIGRAPSLLSIDFGRLRSAKTRLLLSEDPLLAEVKGLERVTELGELRILYSPSLSELSGLNDLTQVGMILLSGNFTRIDAFASLVRVKNELDLAGTFPDYEFLATVERVGTLAVRDSKPATNIFDALPKLTHIDKGINITGAGLTSLDALAGVTKGDDFDLTLSRTSLSNLDGLAGLTLADSVFLTDNDDLVSLRGLADLVQSLRLYVDDNDSLPQCEVDWLFSRVEASIGSGSSGNNGTGTCPP